MASDIAPDIQHLAVPIGSLRTHPSNPRLGSVEVIADSLVSHGQYRPIIAQRSTGHIVAGNHTWMAAKSLKWTQIAVVFLDIDDDLAARIVLVDNRASDLGTYDTAGLLDLLEELPGLDGTGWDDRDIDQLKAALEAALTLSNPGPPDKERGKLGGKDVVRLVVGRIGIRLPKAAWDRWHDDLLVKYPDNKPAIIAWLRFTLGLPNDVQRAVAVVKRRKVVKAAAEQSHPTLDDMVVRIDSLHPADVNARQGDIGAIAESLRVNGQYRPIVVNRRTMQVVAGNHTMQAAKALGWKEIGASFVDVDDEEARRILLVDNRAADLAGYDESVLARMLSNVSTWEGTGFEAEDVEALLAGYGLQRDDLHTPANRRPADKQQAASVLIGQYQFRTPNEEYEAFEYRARQAAGHEPEGLAGYVVDLLGLPPGWQVWRMSNARRTPGA